MQGDELSLFTYSFTYKDSVTSGVFNFEQDQ